MATVCCLQPIAQPRYCPGIKRPLSEADESEGEEETVCRRRCSAVWSNTRSRVITRSKTKIQRMNTTPLIDNFLELLEDESIQDFLWIDSCYQIADRYLIAMAYVYFRRAHLMLDEYTRYNFFVALYLANDMEEDNDDEKYEIFPWALGEGWMTKYPTLLASRDLLWKRMDFRAVVSRRTCEEVIGLSPDHAVWQRNRQNHHGGALRSYMKLPTSRYGRTSPAYCQQCSHAQQQGTLSLPPTPVYSWEPVPKVSIDLLDEIDQRYNQCTTSSMRESDLLDEIDQRYSQHGPNVKRSDLRDSRLSVTNRTHKHHSETRKEE